MIFARYVGLVILGLIFAGCFAHQSMEFQDVNAQDDVITLSFVGDNVLGDYYGSNGQTLNWKFEEVGRDYGYFFDRVRSVLENDDMTLGNLEGPLTTHNGDRLIKPFAFKGSPDYTEILKRGSVEAVNIANNHTRDYGTKGFRDTQKHLKNANICFSGEGILCIHEVRGRKIGMAGHRGWDVRIKPQIKKEIDSLREMGADIVIFSFHWGEERVHYPNEIQREIGRFAIDSGADIVIGHHSHVLQGIEQYKGKKIIYSLGNFVYGGAKNPADKDSIIYQVRFAFSKQANHRLKQIAKKSTYIHNKSVSALSSQEKWNELHSFVPVLISGEKTYNNYQPVIATGEDKKRIIKRMETYSENLSFE